MPHPFEPAWVQSFHVDPAAVHRDLEHTRRDPVSDPADVRAGALRAIRLLDLTSLEGTETSPQVVRLCRRAADPWAAETDAFPAAVGVAHAAAVCVFPEHVETARRALEGTPVRVAAACFGPSPGTGPVGARLAQIVRALGAGADDVDVVISIPLAVAGNWEALHDEIAGMREASRPALLKVILATGALPTLTAVARAAATAALGGADFLKTSTGRETVNATLPAGLVMLETMGRHADRTGEHLGFKPAGGIRTTRGARRWLDLIEAVRGREWLVPTRVRIGASGLLDDLIAHAGTDSSEGGATV